MHKVGPKVCITTATHPGFVGFQANVLTGILPLAGRYGGGKFQGGTFFEPNEKRIKGRTYDRRGTGTTC